MRRFAIGIVMILIIGCGGGEIIGEDSTETHCTHCWLYAGYALTYGDINTGFGLADNEVVNSPEYANISKALLRDKLKSIIVIDNPSDEDFELCEIGLCAINIKKEGKEYGHCQVYDYSSDMFYDNCKCRHGCREPSAGVIEMLYVAVEYY